MDSQRFSNCIKCGAQKPVEARCVPCQRECSRQWKVKNPDKVRAYKAAYNSDPEKKKMASQTYAIWYAKNRDKKLSQHAEWKRRNRDKNVASENKRRAAKNESPGNYTQADWEAITAKQKGKCAICQKKRKLTVDHIIPLSKGGSNMAVNIQGLCFYCNRSKQAKILPDAQYSLFDKAA